MVGMACSLYAALLTLTMGIGGSDAGVIESVTLVSPATIHIKPCQPVFAVLDASATVPGSAAELSEPPLELAQRVTVNGREYKLAFNANPVALFVLDKRSVRATGDGRVSFRTLVYLVWNDEDGAYLFDEPGTFHVGFGAGAELDVIVDEPSDAERALVRKLRDGGLGLASCMLGSTDNRCMEYIPQVEQWLRDYPDTAYTPALSALLGWGKLRMIRDEARARQDRDVAKVAAERLACARQYIEPYCRGELDSPLKAGGAYQLAEVILERVHALEKTDRPAADVTLQPFAVAGGGSGGRLPVAK